MADARGLGRGLDALLGGGPRGGSSPEVRLLPLASIEPNPHQPRRVFDDEALKDLARSIKGQGVLQPVLVRSSPGKRDRYELVAGERRWRAAQMAGLDSIPAMVKEMGDEESLAIALIENLQREDLNPIEEAKGLHELQERFSMSQEQLATRVGKSRSAVANTLRLLGLAQPIQDDISKGILSAGHARALMSVQDEAARGELHGRLVDQGLSVRQAEAQAAYWKKHESLPEGEVQTPKRQAEPASGASAKSVDAGLKEVEDELREQLGIKVKLSGHKDKGRISLYFSSKEELDSLLDRLKHD